MTYITKNKKGFTLIELLLVIVVISVLAGVMLSVINVNVIRGRARDSQRKADMGKIQAALELHYADKRYYPPTGANWIKVRGGTGTVDLLTAALAPTTGTKFINVVPGDPIGNTTTTTPTTPCSALPATDADYRYNYRVGNGNSIYILTALMESNTSDEDSKCDQLSNWGLSVCGTANNVACSCGTGATVSVDATDICYGVQNP